MDLLLVSEVARFFDNTMLRRLAHQATKTFVKYKLDVQTNRNKKRLISIFVKDNVQFELEENTRSYVWSFFQISHPHLISAYESVNYSSFENIIQFPGFLLSYVLPRRYTFMSGLNES